MAKLAQLAAEDGSPMSPGTTTSPGTQIDEHADRAFATALLVRDQGLPRERASRSVRRALLTPQRSPTAAMA